MKRFSAMMLALLGAFVMLLPTVAAQDATPEATPAAVVREVINSGQPVAAEGQILELVRYHIPANISLPMHIHPGMQVAMVESGTLTYTVVEGEATYIRADGTTGILTAGETMDLLPGDSLVEPQGMIHYGENLTDEPLVLLVASLFAVDAPPSSIVEATPAS